MIDKTGRKVKMEQPTKTTKKQNHTRQIAGKQRQLIPISMIGIERIEDIEKKDFCTKTFFKSDLF